MNRLSKQRCALLLFFLTCFIATLVVIGSPSDAQARRRRRRHRVKRLKVINEKKLYERLGGAKSLASITDDWIRAALVDPRFQERLNSFSANPQKLAGSRHRLQLELCDLSDGPCEAKDSEWGLLRSEARLDEAESVSFVSLLSQVLAKHGVGEREKNELLGRLGQVEPAIIPTEVSEATGPSSERRGGNR